MTAQIKAAGSWSRWFDRQLQPQRIADDAAEALASWWPSLGYSPAQLWQRQKTEVEGGWVVMENYQRWLLMRRITTQRQVQEVMTEFWLNHLNVSVGHDAVFTHRVSYDQAIRTHALGRFDEILRAAVVHPAMGMYLDNAVSTKEHPNENLGRELLELHTVGRGSYTEDDVKNSARILTGYLVDMWRTWEATYSPQAHWTGPVSVMGFSHSNSDPDGRAVVAAYLTYLARHPHTAERLARRLCVKFVRDDPPAALVKRLAAVYLDHDTEIRPVLKALVDSAEFKATAGAKVRDPAEDVVATYRALGVTVAAPPRGENGWAASALTWQADTVGAVPCAWPRPDGQPLVNAAWASPARMLASFDVHWVMSGGWWPSEGITYRTPQQWLPQPKVRFDVLVDHLCQQLLGRRSTAAILVACLTACQDSMSVTPATVISTEHGLVRWDFHRLLSTILDSPLHLTR